MRRRDVLKDSGSSLRAGVGRVQRHRSHQQTSLRPTVDILRNRQRQCQTSTLLCVRVKVVRVMDDSAGEWFWSKVAIREPADCWLWVGSKFRSGYGSVWVLSRHRCDRAHRVAYELSKGPIPEGRVVRHTCDTPLCVNPAHLLVGTNRENSADMVARGRQNRGEKNAHAKLTDEKVCRIRQRYDAGDRIAAIATAFRISESHVVNVGRRRVWRHI